MPNTQINDVRLNALQNSKYKNWQDAYAEYSGRRGSNKERREFKKDWRSQDNVKARIGEDNYNQLRAEAEQRQFGAQGYNSGSVGERRRFDRRFDKNVSNGSLRPRVTNTSGSTFTKSGTVLYPWLHDYKLPGSVQNTYNKTMNWLGQYQSNLTGVEKGDPIKKPTPIDYKAEGLKLLGEKYMTSDNLAKIQQFLVDKQYDLGTYGSGGKGVDGKYGQKTHEALLKYLEANPQGKGWADIHALFTPQPESKPEEKPQQEQIIKEQAPVTEQSVPENQNKVMYKITPNGSVGYAHTYSDSFNSMLKNSENIRRPYGRALTHVYMDGKTYPVFVTTGQFHNRKDLINDQSFAYDEKTGKVRLLDENFWGRPTGTWANISGTEAQWGSPEEYGIKLKQGGKMNKIKYFQQGGAAPQQQDMQQQIIQLVQAAMQGDQQATQTIQQVMQAAEQGDQQAQQIAQMIQQVAEQMKGQATMAKWGSKLKYIKSLKYAKGGKTCLECQQGGDISTTHNNSLKNPLKKSVNKVEEKACGGKTKKLKK